MVKRSSEVLDRTFAALSDPTRRAIVARLARGECSVGELAKPFDISWPAVTRHLKVLESARLVERTIVGRVHRLRLIGEPLRDVSEWSERYRSFWGRSLEALEDYLSEEDVP